jgi:dihydroorotase
MQYAKSFDFAVWLRAQDAWLSRGGVVANGAYASRLGLAAIPVEAETIALQTLLTLQRITEVRMHLCRLSSAEAINMVRAVKKEGRPITCDVAANQVHLTDIDIGYYDSHFRLDPPLRGQRDRDAIRYGLLDGTIDAVCSDHTPLTDMDKNLNFIDAVPGAMGLELLLSLTLKWAQEARVPLRDALKLVTHAPGQVLGQSARWPVSPGSLTVGVPADVCVVDPEKYWLVCRENIHSVSQCTPFLGRELPGRVVATVIRGDLVWERSH